MGNAYKTTDFFNMLAYSTTDVKGTKSVLFRTWKIEKKCKAWNSVWLEEINAICYSEEKEFFEIKASEQNI